MKNILKLPFYKQQAFILNILFLLVIYIEKRKYNMCLYIILRYNFYINLYWFLTYFACLGKRRLIRKNKFKHSYVKSNHILKTCYHFYGLGKLDSWQISKISVSMLFFFFLGRQALSTSRIGVTQYTLLFFYFVFYHTKLSFINNNIFYLQY